MINETFEELHRAVEKLKLSIKLTVMYQICILFKFEREADGLLGYIERTDGKNYIDQYHCPTCHYDSPDTPHYIVSRLFLPDKICYVTKDIKGKTYPKFSNYWSCEAGENWLETHWCPNCKHEYEISNGT